MILRATIGALVVAMASLAVKGVAGNPASVPAGSLSISQAAHALIIDYECGGKGYYLAKLTKPEWPGGASGVTIGIGYDCGYNTKAQIAADWSALSSADISALQSVAGLKGQAGRVALAKVRGVVVPWQTALDVFNRRSLSRFGNLTASAMPGTERQAAHGQGALVSLVFNRGSSMAGDSRREMREIRAALIAGKPERVPGQLRAMRRLWVGKGLDGLLRRREAEAALFERGLRGDD